MVEMTGYVAVPNPYADKVSTALSSRAMPFREMPGSTRVQFVFTGPEEAHRTFYAYFAELQREIHRDEQSRMNATLKKLKWYKPWNWLR